MKTAKLVRFRSVLACRYQNVRPCVTFPITNVQYAYVILSYVNRTLTSLSWTKIKLCISYLQPKFTEVTAECVIDSRKRKQKQESLANAREARDGPVCMKTCFCHINVV